MVGNLSSATRHFLIALGAFFLTGCLQIEGEMKVARSGAASMQAAIGIPREVLMFMPASERRKLCTLEQMREIQEIAGDIEIQVEKRVRGRHVFCIVQANADHISKFIEAQEKSKRKEQDPRFADIPDALRQNPDGTYSIVMDFNRMNKEMKGADALTAALVGDSVMRFSLTAPHIDAVQGGKVENGKVTFSIRMAELLLMQPKPVFRVRFWCRRESSWYDPFGWFGTQKTC